MKFFKLMIVGLLAGTAVFAYAQQAQVQTKDATNRNVNEARLVGDLSFQGAIPFGQVFFEYGRTDIYGRTTPQRSVTDAGEFSEKVTGLNEDTGYHFRAVLVAADNSLVYGQDKAFVTKRADSDTPPTTGGTSGDGTDGDTTGTTEPIRPADGDTITDASGASCLGAAAVPIYSDSGQSTTADPGQLGDDLVVTAARVRIIGYRCPTDEDNEDASESGTDVGVGGSDEPRSTGGGTLILNGEGTEATGRGDAQLDDELSKGIVKCGKKGSNTQCGFNDVVITFQQIISFILYFSILIFVGLMTWAGFKYMTAGGSMDTTKNAKKLMTNGLIGMAIIAFAWLGVNSALGLLTDKTEVDAQRYLDNQN